MNDRTPLDSATALARTPLFSQLGRLDLARLAGELEELLFRAGQVMVREGDRADGFYVIKSGWAHVVPGRQSNGNWALNVLGPGEHFGEMAFLTDSTRTATVVAHTDVTVWRLSRARFEALLGHERTIARSIERSLTERLAATTHEAGELRMVAQHLAGQALAAVSPAARALLSALLLRADWPGEALARACARTGWGPALAELEAFRLVETCGSNVGTTCAHSARPTSAFASAFRRSSHSASPRSQRQRGPVNRKKTRWDAVPSKMTSAILLAVGIEIVWVSPIAIRTVVTTSAAV